MFLVAGSGLLLRLLLARYADPDTRATLFLEYEASYKERESPDSSQRSLKVRCPINKLSRSGDRESIQVDCRPCSLR